MTNSKERAAFAALLAKEFDLAPGFAAEIAAKLARVAVALDRLAVRECNVQRDERETAADDRKEENLEKRARKIVADYLPGAECNFNGDPRGYVFKLRVPSRAYNTFGGGEEGWGVPS